MRYDDRWHVHHIDVNERFDAIGYRVVRMEDVVKFRASRQNKILAQTINAANRDEHSCALNNRRQKKTALIFDNWKSKGSSRSIEDKKERK
jgi:hypothetical protein